MASLRPLGLMFRLLVPNRALRWWVPAPFPGSRRFVGIGQLFNTGLTKNGTAA